MSKATKRKHVTKEVLEDYYVPEDDEVIVKVHVLFCIFTQQNVDDIHTPLRHSAQMGQWVVKN